jgi:transposase
MNDTTLYTQILGLDKPWNVTDVQLDVLKEEIIVKIEYASSTGLCPTCQKDCSIHDRRMPRTWRHLDTCQMKTYLTGNLPRVNCSEHGVQTISVAWAESHSSFTMLFEAFTIRLLQATANQSQTCNILRVSRRNIRYIMNKGVKRGLERRKKINIEYLGIDEKSMRKGHTYITVASDLTSGSVIDVVENRTSEAVNELLTMLKSTHNCASLKAVSMDMWKAFMNEVNAVFPYADIVHDRFHIAKYLNEAVDKTRISENRDLVANNDDSLKKSKFLFLKNEENLTEKQAIRFKTIKESNLKTSQAWLIKENFKSFFKCTFVNEAKSYFSQWYIDVKESGLTNMIKVAKILKNHSVGLLNYIKHKISNALAENLNGQIQKIKTIGRGFYAFKNYRNAILFHLGKLDMIPHKVY